MAYRDEIDDKAFDTMQRATLGSPDRMFKRGKLFTESEYNTRATRAERQTYDKGAYNILAELYSEDKSSGKFDNLNFEQFLGVLNNSYLQEKFMYPKEEDPLYYRQGGVLLSDVYGGDPEQLKLSAYNFYADGIDKANISVAAPDSDRY